MDNNNMKTIKFLKENRIELNGVVYKGYSVCNLPPSFGTTEDSLDERGNITARFSIVNEWFNYRGLTYITE